MSTDIAVRLRALVDELQRPLHGLRQRANTNEDFAEARTLEGVRRDIARRLRALLGEDAHCPTCICGRRAPVQGEYGKEPRPAGTVTWAEHEEAYTAYAARFGTSQSAERLAQRGGFGYREMTSFLGHEPTTWVAVGSRNTPDKSDQ